MPVGSCILFFFSFFFLFCISLCNLYLLLLHENHELGGDNSMRRRCCTHSRLKMEVWTGHFFYFYLFFKSSSFRLKILHCLTDMLEWDLKRRKAPYFLRNSHRECRRYLYTPCCPRRGWGGGLNTEEIQSTSESQPSRPLIFYTLFLFCVLCNSEHKDSEEEVMRLLFLFPEEAGYSLTPIHPSFSSFLLLDWALFSPFFHFLQHGLFFASLSCLVAHYSIL